MSVSAYVSEHKYQVAGGAFCVVVLLILVLRGRRSAAPAPVIQGYDPGYNAQVVAQNGQIAAATLQAQSRSADLKAQLDAHIADNATAEHIATIQSALASDLLSQQAGLAAHSDTLQHDTAYETVQASLAAARIGADASYWHDQAMVTARQNDNTAVLAGLQTQAQSVADSARIHSYDQEYALATAHQVSLEHTQAAFLTTQARLAAGQPG